MVDSDFSWKAVKMALIVPERDNRISRCIANNFCRWKSGKAVNAKKNIFP